MLTRASTNCKQVPVFLCGVYSSKTSKKERPGETFSFLLVESVFMICHWINWYAKKIVELNWMTQYIRVYLSLSTDFSLFVFHFPQTFPFGGLNIQFFLCLIRLKSISSTNATRYYWIFLEVFTSLPGKTKLRLISGEKTVALSRFFFFQSLPF